MPYPAQITSLAQSVHLTVKNRYFDDISSADGQQYITYVIDWLNQLFDELENTTDQAGNVVNWNWLRSQDYDFGSLSTGDRDIDLDDDVLNVVSTPDRPLRIEKDGVILSTWAVVSPDQLRVRGIQNAVAKAGTSLFFSRAINEKENEGSLIGDITISIPRISNFNYQALSIIKPKQLLVLGTAKNAVLPDIVQGGLTPSFVQKYNDLLASAIVINGATSEPYFAHKEDFSDIGGIGFA